MWVARDKSGRLFLFESKPVKSPKCPSIWVNDNVTTPIMEIDKSLFPNLTREDEPVEVEFCLNNEKYHTVKVSTLDRIYKEKEELVDRINEYNSLPWYKKIFYGKISI